MDLTKIKQQLELHEERRDRLYIDSRGVPTVGIGRNLNIAIFSDTSIDLMFQEDLLPKWDALCKALPWVKDLDEVRQHVLLDMAFNLGVQGLLGFKNMLTAVRQGDYMTAASHMLASGWASQVRSRALRLSKMMRLGQYPPELQ